MKYLTLLLPFLLFSCTVEPNMYNKDTHSEKQAIIESQQSQQEPQKSQLPQPDTIMLYEDHIGSITLPFPEKDMLNSLKEAFSAYAIIKERGQQDGPDFPLYSLKHGTKEVLFFAMDWEDTLKLDRIIVKEPLVKDKYGLKVGDGYDKIKKLRSGEIKTYTDYHQHTYAYFEGSKIMYEIYGDITLPDTVDLENLNFTEEQIKDWEIEYIIWRN